MQVRGYHKLHSQSFLIDVAALHDKTKKQARTRLDTRPP
jgi:hypothetical protein